MRLHVLTLLLAFAATPTNAQLVSPDDAYHVPFSSSGNTIELAVANTDEASLEGLRVAVATSPAWLTVEPQMWTTTAAKAGEEALAAFTFDVAEDAPVGDAGALRFEIRAEGVLVGEKVLRLQVEAPSEVALRGNYPNPFNPQTTIGFTLPSASDVRLVVYDALGREVARLVEGELGAGLHEARFDGGSLASGLYLYRLVASGEGSRAVKTGRMTLVK